MSNKKWCANKNLNNTHNILKRHLNVADKRYCLTPDQRVQRTRTYTIRCVPLFGTIWSINFRAFEIFLRANQMTVPLDVQCNTYTQTGHIHFQPVQKYECDTIVTNHHMTVLRWSYYHVWPPSWWLGTKNIYAMNECVQCAHRCRVVLLRVKFYCLFHHIILVKRSMLKKLNWKHITSCICIKR